MGRGSWPDRTWHPMLATYEPTAGVWEMRDSRGGVYGVIRIVRRGEEVGYRAEYIDEDGVRHLVGYRTNLAASCLHVHWRYVAAHGPHGAQNGTGLHG